MAACESASKWIGLRTMVMLITVVTVMFGQKPVIDSAKFFDKYNGEVSLAYEGGYVVIKCKLDQAVCTGSIDMVYENVTQASEKCENGIATHRLDFTKSTKFGQYSFRHNNQPSDPQRGFQYDYRTCGKDEITDKCKEDNAFCVVSEGKESKCERLDGSPSALCDNQHPRTRKRVCAGQYDSLCQAIANGQYSSAVVEQEGACAPNPTLFPRVEYVSERVKQNEPIHATLDEPKVDISCPSGSSAANADVKVTLTRSDGTDVPIQHNHTSDCRGIHQVDLPPAIFDRSDIHKFDVVIKKPTPNYEAHLLVYIITTGGNVNCTKDDSGSITRAINCSVIPLLPPSFTADWTITPGGGSATHEGPTLSMQPGVNGTHTIKATVKFQSINPYKQPFKGKSVTSNIDVAVAVPWTASTAPSPPNGTAVGATKTDDLICVGSLCVTRTVFIISIVAFVVVVIAIIVIPVVVYCCWRKRKAEELKREEERKRHEMMHKRVQQLDREVRHAYQRMRALKTLAQAQRGSTPSEDARDLLMGYGVSDVGHLTNGQAEMAKVAKGGEKAKAAYVRDKLGKEVTDVRDRVLGVASMKSRSLTKPKGVPGKFVVSDFYGEPVHVRRFPTREEAYDAYKTFRNDLVGALVVVGPMNPEKAFWSMKRNGVLTFPDRTDQRGRRRVKPTTLAVNRNDDGSTSYKVLVDFPEEPGVDAARPEIFVIHTPRLPSPDDEKSVSSYCEAVDLFAQRHAEQNAKGYPGMAVFCQDGVKDSPAFAGAFVAYQAYLHENATNPIGYQIFTRMQCGDAQWMSKLPPLKLFAFHQFLLKALVKLIGWHTQAEIGPTAAEKQAASIRGASKISGQSQVGTSMVRSEVSQVGGGSQAGKSMVRSEVSRNRSGVSPMRNRPSTSQNRAGPSTRRR